MKKVWMTFIILLILAIPNIKVYALQDSFYEGEYISGEYIKKFKNGSGKFEQLRFFRRRSDNQAVYCIQLWETLNSNKIIEGFDYEQYNYAKMDYTVWEKIMLISYYGYGYGNHTDSKWYAITQFMIWKETSPDSNIFFTDKLNGKKITKYEKEMNEINELVREHSNTPSFNNQTYQVKYGESITIQDTNHVLNKYEITQDGSMEVEKEGDYLTFTKTEIGCETILLTNKDKLYSSGPIVYIDDSGQNLMAPGNYYPINMTINVELPESNLIIQKLDEDTKTSTPQGEGKLEGTIIQLLDKNYQVVSEKEITSDGTLTFEKIGYGTYYIREKTAGIGYLLNPETIKIEINQEKSKIDFSNAIIKNSIILNKYLRNTITGVTKVEKEAVFSIYNYKNEKIGTFKTDDKGVVEIILPYGVYYVKQESGAKNHYYIEDFEIAVTEDKKIQTFDLYNEEITANIKIINVDEDSNLPILEKGSTFRIKNLDTNEYVKEKEKTLELQTEMDGNTPFVKLPVGKYQIEQVTVVDGYHINHNLFNFEVNEETDFLLDEENNYYLEIQVPNQKMKSKIEVDKYIEYYLNDELQKIEQDLDLVIPIYASGNIYSKDGMKLYEENEEVTRATLKDGKIITPEMVFGSYYIKDNKSDSIISILLTKLDSERVELREKVYEYQEIITEVPNTYIEDNSFPKFSILLIVIGSWMIGRKKDEEN